MEPACLAEGSIAVAMASREGSIDRMGPDGVA